MCAWTLLDTYIIYRVFVRTPLLALSGLVELVNPEYWAVRAATLSLRYCFVNSVHVWYLTLILTLVNLRGFVDRIKPITVRTGVYTIIAFNEFMRIGTLGNTLFATFDLILMIWRAFRKAIPRLVFLQNVKRTMFVVLPFTDSVSRVKISASWDARCQIPIPIYTAIIRRRAARAGARLWSLNVSVFTVEFFGVFGTFTVNVQVPFWAVHNASSGITCAFQ